jgi:hypothetical protein
MIKVFASCALLALQAKEHHYLVQQVLTQFVRHALVALLTATAMTRVAVKVARLVMLVKELLLFVHKQVILCVQLVQLEAVTVMLTTKACAKHALLALKDREHGPHVRQVVTWFVFPAQMALHIVIRTIRVPVRSALHVTSERGLLQHALLLKIQFVPLALLAAHTTM